MTKQKRLFIYQAALLLISVLLVMLILTPSVFAASARYYKSNPGRRADPNAECAEGDFRLSPSILFSEDGSNETYDCLSMPDNSISLGPGTVRDGASCPFNYGGLDLGGFGFHCLANDVNNDMYVDPPALDNGETGGDTAPLNQPSPLKSDCDGEAIRAGATDENHCGILDYLVIFINILSAVVGIVVVGSIIYGGIQYTMAGSDPQKVSAAKARIRNALIALLFFIFMYGFLNYLVPGGVL